MERIKILALPVLALLLSAAPAAAKDGFYLGIGTLFNHIGGDTTSPETFENGNGPVLIGGFGFKENYEIEAAIWKTKHPAKPGGSSADVEAGTLDLKILFPVQDSHIEPFILVGVGYYTIEQNRFVEHGNGVRLGVGIDIYMFSDISFDVGFALSQVAFESGTTDLDAKIMSMNYSLAYHF